MGLKVLRYDDSMTSAFVNDIRTNTTTPYLFNQSNWGTVLFRPKLKPMSTNTMSIVTGHKYRIHWGKTGLNWEDLRLEIDENWRVDDKGLYLVHNFSDVRAAINITLDGV